MGVRKTVHAVPASAMITSATRRLMPACHSDGRGGSLPFCSNAVRCLVMIALQVRDDI
jgi:hypothetical protein